MIKQRRGLSGHPSSGALNELNNNAASSNPNLDNPPPPPPAPLPPPAVAPATAATPSHYPDINKHYGSVQHYQSMMLNGGAGVDGPGFHQPTTISSYQQQQSAAAVATGHFAHGELEVPVVDDTNMHQPQRRTSSSLYPSMSSERSALLEHSS
jgi:hypothetical protein